MKQTPEERKQRNLDNLAKARAARAENLKRATEARAVGDYVEPPRKKRPSNLAKIIREILDDDELVDKVIANQPDYWGRLPAKNGGYIIATVMMVKAMGGDIKAADWIRKTGWGDKVVLEDQSGFFGKSDFTIQVIPTKHTDVLNEAIKADDVLQSNIKQIDESIDDLNKTGSSDSEPN